MKEKIFEFLKPLFIERNIEKYLIISESEKADYQINSVFQIAKEKQLNPIEVGADLVSKINNLENFSNYFNEVSFVKPGFINIFVSDNLINECLNDLIDNGIIKKTDSNELYFLDYGGPNIAKPLHIGHLRPAIIGESLNRILKTKGYKTISDVHLGDFGLQLGEVIYGALRDNKKSEDLTIEYLNKIYPEISALIKVDEEVKKECERITLEVQKGNPIYKDYFNKIREISIKDIKRIYEYLDVDFDMWFGESDTINILPDLVNELNNRNLLEIDNGEKIVRVKEDNDNKEMPPVKIENAIGSVGYAATDLATVYERNIKFKPDYILYVVDARQSLHFEGVFRVSKMLGITSTLEHIAFGTINGSDGKPFKTRSGETLKLDELISLTRANFLNKRKENSNMSEEDINKQINAIIKFADLQNNREKSYNFDINKFSDVSGKTGPYILYTAIRIRKILENNNITTNTLTNNIYNEFDKKLRLKLLELNSYIDKAISNRLPSVICEYVYDLCNTVNSFYQNVNISKLEDNTIKNDYLIILNLTYKTIELCLDMLIIKIPSQM